MYVVHLPTNERTQLTAQSSRRVFLGYASGQKGFRCYDTHVKRVRMSRNDVFLDNIFFYHIESSLSPSFSCSNLHLFSNSAEPSSFDRYKPGLVYKRREKTDSATLPPPSLASTTSVPIQLEESSSPVPPEQPPHRQSSRVSHPPSRYGFSYSSFFCSL